MSHIYKNDELITIKCRGKEFDLAVRIPKLCIRVPGFDVQLRASGKLLADSDPRQ